MAYQPTHPNHPTSRAEFLAALNDAHARSGLSLREIAQVCDLDHTYLHLILHDLLPKLVPRIMRVPRPRSKQRSALDETTYR